MHISQIKNKSEIICTIKHQLEITQFEIHVLQIKNKVKQSAQTQTQGGPKLRIKVTQIKRKDWESTRITN